MANRADNAAWHIFNIPYNVAIPNRFCVSQAIREEAGFYSTGDKELDLGLQQEYRPMYLCIAAIALFVDEGAPVRLLNPPDAVTIYDKIVEHLEDWKYIIDNVLNIKIPPIDDFRKLDRFAAGVYEIAGWYRSETNRGTTFFDKLDNMGSNRGGAATGTFVAPDPTIVVPVKSSHKLVSESIARTALRMGKGT